ncbi:MAG: hypothetical protein KGJ43_02850 [Acidobacteriota bacterium]|nr:hypothetical protein [Acidobacteriota bacterium]
MRTDPTETGGLFLGRRPGTAPVRFRSPPVEGSPQRRRMDRGIASALFSGMVVLCLLCWGPIPLLGLWIGSQIDYQSGSAMLGIFAAFAAVIAGLLGVLALLTRIDRAWVLVRRAGGVDQRSGAMARVFAVTAVLCALIFLVWFLVIHGPGPTTFSGQSGV